MAKVYTIEEKITKNSLGRPDTVTFAIRRNDGIILNDHWSDSRQERESYLDRLMLMGYCE